MVVVEAHCIGLALGPGRGLKVVEDNLVSCTLDSCCIKDIQGGSRSGKVLKLAFRQGPLKCQGKF